MNIADIIADRDAGTPGPWSNHGQPDVVCCEGYTSNGAAKVVTVASSRAWMKPLEPFANASRIARVPDMEAALIAQSAEIERLRGALEYILDGHGFNGPDYLAQDGEDDDWITLCAREALKGGAE